MIAPSTTSLTFFVLRQLFHYTFANKPVVFITLRLMPPRGRKASQSTTTTQSTPQPRKRGRPPSTTSLAANTPSANHASTTPTPSKRRRRNAATVPSIVPVTETPDATPDETMNDIGMRADRGEEAVGSGRTYFEAHKGALTTSNFTLSSLSICGADELTTAFASFRDRDPLRPVQHEIYSSFRLKHDSLQYLMDTGHHSLLIYGLGSKRAILDHLASTLSSSSDVVVIHGYNPTTNLRSALTQIATDLLGLRSFTKRSLLDYVDAIRDGIRIVQKQQQLQQRKKNSSSVSNRRRSGTGVIKSSSNSSSTINEPAVLSIVVHNIDGTSLRSADAQLALSKLAAISCVRFVASVDHINAALLWDASVCASFSWWWIPCHSFQPYDAETFFASRPLWRGGAERRVEGAVAMLKSLTERARNVFRELVVRQIHGGGDNNNDGAGAEGTVGGENSPKTTFNELFVAVKQQFIVSDQETLRVILTELKTHNLLQMRRREDAAELLSIPLADSQLEEILNEIGLEA